MSKGLGKIERYCLEALRLNVREGSLTVPGQQLRLVKAASLDTILQAIYDRPVSRAKRVSVARALKTLAQTGRIGIFYITENGRRHLYAEQITINT